MKLTHLRLENLNEAHEGSALAGLYRGSCLPAMHAHNQQQQDSFFSHRSHRQSMP